MGGLHVRAIVLPDGVEQDLYVDGGSYVDAEPEGAVTLHAGGYALPGLVDLHNHLSLRRPAGDDASPDQRVRASGRLEVSRGVLALREPGSLRLHARRVPSGGGRRNSNHRSQTPAHRAVSTFLTTSDCLQTSRSRAGRL